MSISTPAQVWEDYNYKGSTSKLSYRNYSNVSSLGIPNDSVSSVKVAPFTRLILYDDSSYRGKKISISGPREIPNLSVFTGDMNDAATSFKVERIEPSGRTIADCCTGKSSSYECGEFKPNSSTCVSSMGEYCTAARMNLPECRSFCKENPAECDAAVISYCKDNTDPFCACVNSPAAITGAINPKCIDRACLDTGYLTSNMIQTSCPSVVNCKIQNTLVNSGIVLSNSTPIEQNCGAGGEIETNILDDGSKNYVIYALVFIFILVAVYFLIFEIFPDVFPGIFSESNVNS